MPSQLDQDYEGPVIKRRRLSGGSAPRVSRIFAPYRTIGVVSPTPVPFTYTSLGKTTFQVTTSVGRSLHTYDLRRGLHLIFITRPQTPGLITATNAYHDRVFAAWVEQNGDAIGIWVFKRGKRVGELEIPDGLSEPVQKILNFGSWIVGCCRGRIEIWNASTLEHYTTLTSASNDGEFGSFTGHVCNLPTFLNKIFAGKQDGSVELWNVSTGKLIYTFAPITADGGPVTALEPAPAIGLLAISRGNGSLLIHDMQRDHVVYKLNTSTLEPQRIDCIAFRADDLGAGQDGQKAGVMATARADSGDVVLWDLNEGGRVMGVLRGAHHPPSKTVAGGITMVCFLPGQPVLLTSGLDNSLKSWIFDESPYSPIPRMLHSRAGHAAAVNRLEFLPAESDGSDATGKWLISAAKDQSLWGWSLRRDAQSAELSQGNITSKAKKLGLANGLNATVTTSLEDLKAPEITCMATCLNRDGGMGASLGGGAIWSNITKPKNADPNRAPTGWESMITGHRGDKHARTWFWGRRKAGRWAFPTTDSTEVTSVAISLCGTFALIGSAGGGVDMYNMQSGIHRQRFPAPISAAQFKRRQSRTQGAEQSIATERGNGKAWDIGEGKHSRQVTGIVVESLNRKVISCSLDGKVKFWNFKSGLLLHEIDWSPMVAITHSRFNRSSELLALACDDLSIRIVDIETRKLVRELWGCVGQISDFCFSNDGRWLIAASMDGTVRTWDLPTGNLIDAVKFGSTCAALAFSPTGEFLATAHTDSVGIHVWTNRALFANVPTNQIREDDILSLHLPSSSGEGGQGLLEAAFEEDKTEGEDLPDISGMRKQLDEAMATLSLVPRPRWQTLLHLDVISARNKPIEPPKAPDRAPFFLPSLRGKGENAAALDQLPTVAVPSPNEGRSRISTLQRDQINRPFTKLLHTAAEDVEGNPESQDVFLEHLKSLSPPMADVEIRSLDRFAAHDELLAFVRLLTLRLRRRQDYELVQAWMAVFLKAHSDSLGSDPKLLDALKDWRAVQAVEAHRLGRLVGYCSGVVGFLRSGR